MEQDVKILSLIPESLHEELIKEVQEVLQERTIKKDNPVSVQVKEFVEAQAKQRKKESKA
ncbi:MAG: hypothetical protein ACTHM7_14180 [Ginsengibacter sp.]